MYFKKRQKKRKLGKLFTLQRSPIVCYCIIPRESLNLHFLRINILITFEVEVKMIRNCLIVNVMFIKNDTLWV